MDIVKGIRAAEQMLIDNGVFYPMFNVGSTYAYLDDVSGIFAVGNTGIFDFTVRADNDV